MTSEALIAVSQKLGNIVCIETITSPQKVYKGISPEILVEKVMLR